MIIATILGTAVTSVGEDSTRVSSPTLEAVGTFGTSRVATRSNTTALLNQAHAWFLKIDMVQTSVCVCVCVCVCPPPGLLKTIHVK